jgi:hypothetical protein
MNAVKVTVLPSQVREVPAAHLTAGARVFRPDAFTAMWVEKPDAHGVARVASAMGPSFTGDVARIVERDTGTIVWEIDTDEGPRRFSHPAGTERTRQARVLILTEEGS